MELQFLNLKIYASGKEQPDLRDFIPVFHRWIQKKNTDELLIDVANYAHVPAGPGIILIAHEANYSVEYGPEEKIGLLYKMKLRRAGTNHDRLAHALRQTLYAATKLEQDESLAGRLTFNRCDFRLTLSGRSQVSNDSATFDAIKPNLDAFFKTFCPRQRISFHHVSGDSRERLAIHIQSDVSLESSMLLQKVGN